MSRLAPAAFVLAGCLWFPVAGGATATTRESASHAARTYVSALRNGRARTVCRYLADGQRRALAGGSSASAGSCARAVRKLIGSGIPHIRVARVRVHGPMATVVISDPQQSDSGSDAIRMKRIDGRWRVLDL